MRPPPEDAAKGYAAGRSPGSRVEASFRPSRSNRSSGRLKGARRLQLWGQPRNRENPHRVPFRVPPHAGTDDGWTIAAFRLAASCPLRPPAALSLLLALALPQPDGEKAIEQRFVGDAGSLGGVGEFVAIGDVGIRVGLEEIRPLLGIEAKVDARVAAEL